MKVNVRVPVWATDTLAREVERALSKAVRDAADRILRECCDSKMSKRARAAYSRGGAIR